MLITNQELFFELCRKYDVKMSDKYDTPMIEIDGELVEVTIEMVNEIFGREKTYA